MGCLSSKREMLFALILLLTVFGKCKGMESPSNYLEQSITELEFQRAQIEQAITLAKTLKEKNTVGNFGRAQEMGMKQSTAMIDSAYELAKSIVTEDKWKQDDEPTKYHPITDFEESEKDSSFDDFEFVPFDGKIWSPEVENKWVSMDSQTIASWNQWLDPGTKFLHSSYDLFCQIFKAIEVIVNLLDRALVVVSAQEADMVVFAYRHNKDMLTFFETKIGSKVFQMLDRDIYVRRAVENKLSHSEFKDLMTLHGIYRHSIRRY